MVFPVGADAWPKTPRAPSCELVFVPRIAQFEELNTSKELRKFAGVLE